MNPHPRSSWTGAPNSPEPGLCPGYQEQGRAAAGLEKWRGAGVGGGGYEKVSLGGGASRVVGRGLS